MLRDGWVLVRPFVDFKDTSSLDRVVDRHSYLRDLKIQRRGKFGLTHEIGRDRRFDEFAGKNILEISVYFASPYHLSQTRAYHVMFYLEIKTGKFILLGNFFELLKKLRQTFAKTEFGTKFHQLLIGQATHGSVLS